MCSRLELGRTRNTGGRFAFVGEDRKNIEKDLMEMNIKDFMACSKRLTYKDFHFITTLSGIAAIELHSKKLQL